MKIFRPAGGPPWLPDFARSIERGIGGVRGAGAFGGSVRTVTASATVAGDDFLILADCTAGAVTLTLPAAATSNGRYLVAKKIDASANAMTLDASGAELIDGAATKVATMQYVALTLFCDGAGWWIV